MFSSRRKRGVAKRRTVSNHRQPSYVLNKKTRVVAGRHKVNRLPDRTVIKNLLLVLLILACLVATVSLLYFHPYFNIKVIGVNGLKRIDYREFNQKIDEKMAESRFLFFNSKNYFTFPISKFHEELKKDYPIESLTITKEFPDRIYFNVEEQLTTVIYDNGSDYRYLDISGLHVEKLRDLAEDEWIVETKTVTSTNWKGDEVAEEVEVGREHKPNFRGVWSEFGEFPIILDTRDVRLVENLDEDRILPPEIVDGVIGWYDYLKKFVQVEPGYFHIESDSGTATIYTGEGWYLKVNLKANRVSQYDTLSYLLENSINRASLEYIDLRFGERVYYK